MTMISAVNKSCGRKISEINENQIFVVLISGSAVFNEIRENDAIEISLSKPKPPVNESQNLI